MSFADLAPVLLGSSLISAGTKSRFGNSDVLSFGAFSLLSGGGCWEARSDPCSAAVLLLAGGRGGGGAF